MSSPTQRSLEMLRREGWKVAIVEKWNPAVKRRQDLWGFVDILAIRGTETLAVQTTSDSNVAGRVRKIGESSDVAAVRAAGWSIHVHGWKSVQAKTKKGTTRKQWKCRIVDVS